MKDSLGATSEAEETANLASSQIYLPIRLSTWADSHPPPNSSGSCHACQLSGPDQCCRVDRLALSSSQSAFGTGLYRRQLPGPGQAKTFTRDPELSTEMARPNARSTGGLLHSLKTVQCSFQSVGYDQSPVSSFETMRSYRVGAYPCKAKSMPSAGNNHPQKTRQTFQNSILVRLLKAFLFSRLFMCATGCSCPV